MTSDLERLAALDKQAVKDAALAEFERSIQALKASVEITVAGATHEEAKPENDKDTRALEQTYLARGQAQRVVETRTDAARLRAMDLRRLDAAATIVVGALIGVSCVERLLGCHEVDCPQKRSYLSQLTSRIHSVHMCQAHLGMAQMGKAHMGPVPSLCCRSLPQKTRPGKTCISYLIGCAQSADPYII